MKWSEIESQQGPSKYYKTKVGANRFRIVSEAIPVWTAFDRVNKTARKYLDSNQAAGDREAKMRYAMWVIDRADNNFKVAEFGFSITSQIQELSASEQYGFTDLPKYDMTLNRKGEGLETEYTLIPDRMDKPLTAAEAVMASELENLTTFFEKEIAKDKNKKSDEIKVDEIPF